MIPSAWPIVIIVSMYGIIHLNITLNLMMGISLSVLIKKYHTFKGNFLFRQKDSNSDEWIMYNDTGAVNIWKYIDMNIRDLYANADIDLDMDIAVNVDGFILPVENVRVRDGRTVFIISASALEDRDLDGQWTKTHRD